MRSGVVSAWYIETIFSDGKREFLCDDGKDLPSPFKTLELAQRYALSLREIVPTKDKDWTVTRTKIWCGDKVLRDTSNSFGRMILVEDSDPSGAQYYGRPISDWFVTGPLHDKG